MQIRRKDDNGYRQNQDVLPPYMSSERQGRFETGLEGLPTGPSDRSLGVTDPPTSTMRSQFMRPGSISNGNRELAPLDTVAPRTASTGPLSTDLLRAVSENAYKGLSMPGLKTAWMAGNAQNCLSMPGLNRPCMSLRLQRVFMILIFFAVGFSAITALSIAIFGWLSLDIAAYLLVWPSLVVWLIVGVLYPEYGKLALRGFIIGVFACFFYDCMRFASIGLGLWADFIPRIGMWLFHTDKPDWVVGYLWRYIGDGGFMGTAFVVSYRLLKPKVDIVVAAVLFGIAIWVCLVATVLLAPHGKDMLFTLTPITFSLSLLGHIIYGFSIGLLYQVRVNFQLAPRKSP